MDLRKLLLLAFVLSGMAALVYELTWIRPLQFLLGSTTYTISIIFAAFMAGLGLGSWIISKYVDRISNLPKAYALMELGIGLYGVFLLIIFNILPDIYRIIYPLHQSFYVFEFVQFLLVFIVLLIPTTLMGATFPIVAKFYTKEKIGKGVGEIYSANNLGAIIGSFSAGFILIPLLGIKWSIVFAGSINLLLGFVILSYTTKKSFKKIIALVLILFLFLAIVYAGSYNIQKLYSGGFSRTVIPKQIMEKTEFLFYEEGLYGTVAVIINPLDDAISLLIDGKGQGSVAIKDLRVNYLLSYLPLLLNPKADNALVIGLGTGATSGHLANLVKTTTVEIEPKILEASKYFTVSNSNVLENQNHDFIITDARNYLLKTETKYDVIAQQTSDPWQSFSTNLFSKEYFELVDEHLNEDGLYLDWVPIYTMTPDDFRSFYKTFNSVFPNVIVFANLKGNEEIPFNPQTGELVFVGSKKKIAYEDKINENFDLLPSYAKGILRMIWIDSSDDLLNLFMFTNEDMAGYAADAELITDDNLKLEFSTARSFLVGSSSEIISDINKFLKKDVE